MIKTSRTATRSSQPKKCCQCDAEGLVVVEHGNWLCAEHITERMHRPDAVAANEAERELDDFFDSGGKLS